MKNITIQLLLRKDRRSAENARHIAKECTRLGMVPRSMGATTVSVEMSLESFKKQFGIIPQVEETSPPSESNFGSPGGYRVNEVLPVPEELREWVEQITVPPPYSRF